MAIGDDRTIQTDSGVYAHTLPPPAQITDWEPLDAHLAKVAALAGEFCGAFGAGDWGETLGWLHDVGKIGIDDQVLRKHGKLTTEEFEHIKEHPDLGCKILADLKPLASVIPAVRHHHEQWDGRGYPCKLAGEEIPLIARIVAVADAYDAMTSDRPYRRGMSSEVALSILREHAGTQFDPEIVKFLIQAAGQGHLISATASQSAASSDSLFRLAASLAAAAARMWCCQTVLLPKPPPT